LGAIISHGGTEKWVRKENLAAETKAVPVIVEPFNAQDVAELYLQIRRRNTPREFQLLNLNWQGNFDNRVATFRHGV
jgi:hypothetical protein